VNHPQRLEIKYESVIIIYSLFIVLKTFLNAQHIINPIIGYTFCKHLEKDHQCNLERYNLEIKSLKYNLENVVSVTLFLLHPSIVQLKYYVFNSNFQG